MSDESISEQEAPASFQAGAVRVGIRRTSAIPETLKGQLNGRTVVTATREEGRVNWVTHRSDAGYPVWSIWITGLPGDDFTVTHVGDAEEIVQKLTDLVASAILRPYPLETTKEKHDAEA